MIYNDKFKNSLLIVSLLIFLLFTGCSSGEEGSSEGSSQSSADAETSQPSSEANGENEEQAMIENGLGVGPVKEVNLSDEIDSAMVEEGKQIYQQNCTACHQPDKDLIGPSPIGVLDRRKPEWIMNMILNPREMVQKDPTAQKLQSEYNSVMSQQITDRNKARKILEYFRTLEKSN